MNARRVAPALPAPEDWGWRAGWGQQPGGAGGPGWPGGGVARGMGACWGAPLRVHCSQKCGWVERQRAVEGRVEVWRRGNEQENQGRVRDEVARRQQHGAGQPAGSSVGRSLLQFWACCA